MRDAAPSAAWPSRALGRRRARSSAPSSALRARADITARYGCSARSPSARAAARDGRQARARGRVHLAARRSARPSRCARGWRSPSSQRARAAGNASSRGSSRSAATRRGRAAARRDGQSSADSPRGAGGVEFSIEVGRGTTRGDHGPCDDLHALRAAERAGAARRAAAAAARGARLLARGIQPGTPPSARLLTGRPRYLQLLAHVGEPWLWFGVTASDQIPSAPRRTACA